jgi:acyl carrier protein
MSTAFAGPDQVKTVIARELRLPVELLADDAPASSVGLDSLGLAQSVVAVEEALGREIDTALLSGELRPDMTVGELVRALLASWAETPAAGAAA